MTHHDLDPYPDSKEKSPLYINEPWLFDKTLLEYPVDSKPNETDDNVRVFIPMDLNKDAILRRLEEIIPVMGRQMKKMRLISVQMLICLFSR